MGLSMGISLKGLVKRVWHNESPTVGCTEIDLVSIWVIESQLYDIFNSSFLHYKLKLNHFLIPNIKSFIRSSDSILVHWLKI